MLKEEQERVNRRRADGSRDSTSSSSHCGLRSWCSVGKCQILLLSPVLYSLFTPSEPLDSCIFSEMRTIIFASKQAGKNCRCHHTLHPPGTSQTHG